MADNFGLRIGVEGEKEFKKALAEINQSFKVLGSEMNLVASQFDRQDKSVEAITARNRVLNKEIDTQKQKIGTLEQALQNATASFGENDRRTVYKLGQILLRPAFFFPLTFDFPAQGVKIKIFFVLVHSYITPTSFYILGAHIRTKHNFIFK